MDSNARIRAIETLNGWRDVADWYSIGSIRFTEEQNLWIMTHYEEIIAGRWPACPRGHENPEAQRVKSKPFPSGYYTKPIEVWSELSWRLERCIRRGGHDDGFVVFCLYCLKYEPEHVAKLARVSMEQLAVIEARVMEYTRGKGRRKRPYFECWSHPKVSKYPTLVREVAIS